LIPYLIIFIVLQNPAAPRVSFGAVGDILLDRGTRASIRQHGVDFPFEAVAGLIRGFDLAYANLESPVSSRGRSTGKLYCFRGDTNFFTGVQNAGFDIISIANNHTIDWGQTAFFDTKDIIEDRGLIPVGFASAAAAAPAPVMIEKNGLRFAFFAGVGAPLRGVIWPLSLSGPCQADSAALAASVREIRPDVDFVICGMHWGEEYVYRPMAENVRWAHLLVDAGADLIVGSHPHILQSIEVYKDRLILYSLGNFVYDQHKTYQRQSGIFTCVFRKGKIDSAAFIPAFLNDFRPGLVQGKDFDSIAARMKEISMDYHARFRAGGDRLFITDEAARDQYPVPIARRKLYGRNCVVHCRRVEFDRGYGPDELSLRPDEVIKDAAFIPDNFNPALALIAGPRSQNRNRLVLLLIEPAGIRSEPSPRQDLRPWKIVSLDLDADSTFEICAAGLKKEPFQSTYANYLFVYEWRDRRLVLKSRGAKFPFPLLDFACLDINADGLQELIALENAGSTEGHDVNAYQWCGHGFYGYKTLSRAWTDNWLNEKDVRKLLTKE
jgi:poly-gamma-glutamate synthesis protein (capsule biosynthesis protein)